MLFRGLDVLQVDEDFARADESELLARDFLDRRTILTQPPRGISQLVILAAETINGRAEVGELLPRAGRRDEAAFANECIREKHHGGEDEQEVQGTPPKRRRCAWLHTFAPERFRRTLTSGANRSGIWGNRRHRLGLSFVQYFRPEHLRNVAR